MCRNDKYRPSKEEMRIKNKVWRDANPDKLRGYELKKLYGITFEQFNQMIEDQHGCCAICGEAMEKPCVDHNHATGVVRRLLCLKCNMAIGLFYDSPKLLRLAADYLEEFE